MKKNIIKEAMEKAGLEPVIFDKPLKHVSANVLLKKELKPGSLVERHSVIGWGLGNLIEHFGKGLYAIKAIQLRNEEKVVVEAMVYFSISTFEDNHEDFFREYVSEYTGKDYPQHGYYYEKRFFKWDSAEIIGAISVGSQTTGAG
jgi:hypothetical protein